MLIVNKSLRGKTGDVSRVVYPSLHGKTGDVSRVVYPSLRGKTGDVSRVIYPSLRGPRVVCILQESSKFPQVHHFKISFVIPRQGIG